MTQALKKSAAGNVWTTFHTELRQRRPAMQGAEEKRLVSLFSSMKTKADYDEVMKQLRTFCVTKDAKPCGVITVPANVTDAINVFRDAAKEQASSGSGN